MTKTNVSTLNATLDLSDREVACGKAGLVPVKVSRLDPATVARVFDYGLKQLVNDAGAAGKTADEKLGLINKRLEAMYAGTYGVSRASGPRASTDPVGAEALRIARDMAKQRASIRAFESKDAAAEWVRRFAAQDSTRELAQRRLDEAKALDLDLGD